MKYEIHIIVMILAMGCAAEHIETDPCPDKLYEPQLDGTYLERCGWRHTPGKTLDPADMPEVCPGGYETVEDDPDSWSCDIGFITTHNEWFAYCGCEE